jgi:hypothetical protein
LALGRINLQGVCRAVELAELKSDSKTAAGTNSTNYASPAYTLISIGCKY